VPVSNMAAAMAAVALLLTGPHSFLLCRCDSWDTFLVTCVRAWASGIGVGDP